MATPWPSTRWSIPVLPRDLFNMDGSPLPAESEQGNLTSERDLPHRRCFSNADGIMNYHNAGKSRLRVILGYALQRMLGHLTTLIPKNPRSILVIDVAPGVRPALSACPTTEHVTIAEIERSFRACL